MNSELWHAVGIVAVIAFAFAVVLALVARTWFKSSNSATVKRGANVLSALGGASNARYASSEMKRRNVK